MFNANNYWMIVFIFVATLMFTTRNILLCHCDDAKSTKTPFHHQKPSSGDTKLTFTQKIAAAGANKNRDIQQNTIPGSSEVYSYVPESIDHLNRSSNIDNFVSVDKSLSTKTHQGTSEILNTTRSQANVFEAVTNTSQKDPLLVNAQSPNQFLANGPAGVNNPQIALLLQQNPRLQMLAQQNPIIAQQIMRNPALLRDPQIQSK